MTVHVVLELGHGKPVGAILFQRQLVLALKLIKVRFFIGNHFSTCTNIFQLDIYYMQY